MPNKPRDLSGISDPYELPMIVSVGELAQAWARAKRTIYAMIADGRLHAIRLGGTHGQLVIRRADALAAMGLPPERPAPSEPEAVAS
jgi:excisionase family DNA binding protein